MPESRCFRALLFSKIFFDGRLTEDLFSQQRYRLSWTLVCAPVAHRTLLAADGCFILNGDIACSAEIYTKHFVFSFTVLSLFFIMIYFFILIADREAF